MKHANYDNPCDIKIVKVGKLYRLEYPKDGYELIGTLEEILEEIKEHLELMKEV